MVGLLGGLQGGDRLGCELDRTEHWETGWLWPREQASVSSCWERGVLGAGKEVKWVACGEDNCRESHWEYDCDP